MAVVRVGAAQTANRTIPFRIGDAEVALRQVEKNLDSLVALAERAADEGCQVLAFPEDTLGTLEWQAGHRQHQRDFLALAGERMLSRFADVARRRHLAIICCNDLPGVGTGTHIHNTAVLLGFDGNEIGRYLKVQPTLAERGDRVPGDAFPVFELAGVGTVGLCICYDMLFPETTRVLALNGAELVFHCTLGGASMGDADADLAAFRTRAGDNFLYLVVAWRGGNSRIFGPKGQILAAAERGVDRLICADIDPQSGRDSGDALGGTTQDFRARLWRERNPAAYAVLVDPQPPALRRLAGVPVEDVATSGDRFAAALTTGAEAFDEGERWLQAGNAARARARFVELSAQFGTVWIGRAARERLARIDKAGGDGITRAN